MIDGVRVVTIAAMVDSAPVVLSIADQPNTAKSAVKERDRLFRAAFRSMPTSEAVVDGTLRSAALSMSLSRMSE